jgi:hypothetical protein
METAYLHCSNRGHSHQPRIAEVHSLQTVPGLELCILTARPGAPDQQ